MSDQPQDPNDVERLLRALAAEDLDDGLPAPDDERLRAWREGRLSEDEARELEGLLARSAAGRRRLLGIAGVAGVDRSLPLRRVRKAVLDGARPDRNRSWRTVAAIAAMLVLAVIGVFLRQPVLPEGLAYDVSGRGLADVRSEGETTAEVRAYPGTTVRIVLRPQGDSPSGLSFALFRREDGGLRRVREPEEVRLEAERGSATFSGIASRVLGTETPGRHEVYVVVSASKRIPARVENPEDLRSSGRLIYPMTITLLPESLP
ncbi:MAG: hypothetical protein ABUT39_02365 [Acidobacteriota bacterium]